ncbi:amidohydrolase family protein [Salipaludibacillus sp. CF4.18]|uniref:amidohydrolase family protein n=1 Tax=Salipaludibacillus sp. CF4.18 TaxID=3373081 RepID=UPI003EE591FF
MNIFDEPKIDCHNHIFDPERFPYADDVFYRPSGQEISTADQFLQVFEAYGLKYSLVVGPNSGYGTDNRCLIDAIARSGGRFKGIAVVDNDVEFAELQSLKADGIIGIAFNVTHYGVDYYINSAKLLEKLVELDLFLQVQVQGDELVSLMPLLKESSVRILIDHSGRPLPDRGLDQPGFKELLELGKSGRGTVKLSGFIKFSQEPYPYTDTWPFIQALVDSFTLDACIWGSDWPFLRASERVDYGTLLKLVEKIFPDAADRRKLFWETPYRLFNFGN